MRLMIFSSTCFVSLSMSIDLETIGIFQAPRLRNSSSVTMTSPRRMSLLSQVHSRLRPSSTGSSGFYPEFFERRFFERDGPSVAVNGEEDDSQKLVEFVQSKKYVINFSIE
ncbi:hypothetical protein K469DRAFT_14950 [Zopfia rhizophila CBS 207.26]|uniref:Uncharacterized protein n=1 Tax=Zopfia rhizophila CBS 207.26 TaxID=1314779 RepID=A0A6A6EXS5_9PEZI|nr:hypothetical protein K469DRAFT_14950 [Zopfia rhizophila CBS 207.26]